MITELQEINDWNLIETDTDNDKMNKSISAYYLNNWYERVKEISFETVIIEIKSDIKSTCPETLPFIECMVRYENKSPKDSEFWGPCKTKTDVIKIFATSLRCRKYKGKYLCFRKWNHDIIKEYRCFWNCGLVACSCDIFSNIAECQSIVDYVNSIQHLIPYNKCVFDIVLVNGDTIEFKLVEFNSWETNSGGHTFSWIDDTEILYPTMTQKEISMVFRSDNKTEIKIMRPNSIIFEPSLIDTNQIKVIKPWKPSNWLVTDKFIYITTDIWLGRFTLDLKNLNWKRGVYRFCKLYLCKDGTICVNSDHLYYDLSKSSSKSEIDMDIYNNQDIVTNCELYKYGLYCYYEEVLNFCQLTNDGFFKLHAVDK